MNNKNFFLYECLTYNWDVSRYFSIVMKFELSIKNTNEIMISKINETKIDNAFEDIQSFFITEQKKIILFYGNLKPTEYYIILVFDQNLNQLHEEKIEDSNINIQNFFYSIHYQGEIGVFIYYRKLEHNSNFYYPYIFFKKYNPENNVFQDYFSNNNYIVLDKYHFDTSIFRNDLIKISNKKIAFFASEDSYIIYIVILNIIDMNNIKIRYYRINSFSLYNYKIYVGIRAHIFNNFIIFGSIQCQDVECSDFTGYYFPSFITFSFPNSTDIYINLIDHLFINNQIKIDNLLFDLYSNSVIENNLFGLIFDGIVIQNLTITSENINLYAFNQNKLIGIKDKLNRGEKIKINYINIKNEFEPFIINIEYAFIVTEPEYAEYEKYPETIDTKYGNDNKDYFNNNKELYIGKTLYYILDLNESLKNDCEKSECQLCLANNPSYCITCRYNYSIINNQKICDIYPCSNDNVLNNKCTNIIIPKEQAEEIYNLLTNKIKNNEYNNSIIQTENIIFQLSSLEDQTHNKNISSVKLGECENILKGGSNKTLLILKTDVKSEDLLSTYVLFDIYNPENTENKIDLGICEDTIIEISVPKILDNQTLYYYVNLNKLGYNLFNPNDSFYRDICTLYTTINKKDMILPDRLEDIYIPSNDQYYCQENCQISSYNITTKKVNCKCILKKDFYNEYLENINFDYLDYKEIISIFKKTLKNSNFKVLKCCKMILLFSRFIKNIGSIIMAIIILIFLILMIIYCFTGQKKIEEFLKIIYLSNKFKYIKRKKFKRNKKRKSNQIIANLNNNPPIKKININKSNKIINIQNSYSIYASGSPQINNMFDLNKLRQTPIINIKKNMKIKIKKKKSKNNKKRRNKTKPNKINIKNSVMNTYELNVLPYIKAIQLDKRSFFEFYISLIRRKHLILFAFVPYDDYNLKTIKISFFLLSFSLYFALNGFFFNDNTMHQIYKDNNEYNILIQLSIILYSSAISSVVNFIIKLLSLSEKDILSIKGENSFKIILENTKKIKKRLTIKFIIFYIIGFILLIFIWIFISCFCAVFINTAIVLVKDTLISFAISMVYPFGINLLPAIFRIPALRAKNHDKECLYVFSKYLIFF